MLVGSCFSDNMGHYFDVHRFDVCSNPFGVLFNPISIDRALRFMLQPDLFDKNRYFYKYRDLWVSFAHHGRFSKENFEIFEADIEQNLQDSSDFLYKTRYLFVTFGTAFCYKFIPRDLIVSNCHKIPNHQFERIRLDVKKIVAQWNSMHALHEGQAQLGGEVGVLAVGLLTAAPAGIAEDVHVGGPEGQAVIDVAVSFPGEGVVLGPRLVGDHGSDPLHEVFVEHGGHADGLGEAGGGAAPGEAVQPLVPPVICGDPQPLDGWRVEAKLSGLFLSGHAADQFLSKLSCAFTRHTPFSFRLSLSRLAVLFPLPGASPAR